MLCKAADDRLRSQRLRRFDMWWEGIWSSQKNRKYESAMMKTSRYAQKIVEDGMDKDLKLMGIREENAQDWREWEISFHV